MKVPKIITKTILGIIGAVLSAFIIHNLMVRVSFWKDTWLDEALVTVPGFLFGFWVVPWLATSVLRWFVGLVTTTVQVTVARTMGSFLAAQNKKLAERREEKERQKKREQGYEKLQRSVPPILLDTSAIIDGRFLEIAKAGFFLGLIILPKFVIDELQHLADSGDALKRQKGRRGLELLNLAKKEKKIKLTVSEEAVEGKDVDERLRNLAKLLKAQVATVDYNLNKSLTLLGISVLNVNDLANLIKTVVLPGDTLTVKVIQKGKENRQGVGYLPDGTMIVVENGENLLGQECGVKVARLLQTPAGKMIFAKPQNDVKASQ